MKEILFSYSLDFILFPDVKFMDVFFMFSGLSFEKSLDVTFLKWNKYSSINIRQLQFYSINPKLDFELFVDLAEFTLFLPVHA